mgnify:CR=1 FL=1
MAMCSQKSGIVYQMRILLQPKQIEIILPKYNIHLSNNKNTNLSLFLLIKNSQVVNSQHKLMKVERLYQYFVLRMVIWM